MKFSIQYILDKPERCCRFVLHGCPPLDLDHTFAVVGVYGYLVSVAIGLTYFEEQGEIEFVSVGIKILSDIVTDDVQTKDWGNVVLGERAYGGLGNLGVET